MRAPRMAKRRIRFCSNSSITNSRASSSPCERQCSMQPNRSIQSSPTALLSQWQSVTPLPTARYGPTAVLGADGRIYILGGANSSGDLLDTVEAYDPRTQSWTVVTSMPTARFNLAAVLGPDGHIYTLGGANSSGDLLDTVEVYDPTTKSWTTGVSLPTPRSGLAAVLGPDRHIYALGGFNNERDYFTTVEIGYGKDW